GGALGPSVHPEYGACSLCGTLVLQSLPEPGALKGYYGIDAYWRGEVVNVSGYPSIDERARKDFADRIPVWWRILKRYSASPHSLLEIACSHGGFLAYARERGVEEVVGIEVDEGTCRFAMEHFNLPHVVSGLFPDVSLPRTCFDAIVGFDVFEHFRDPEAAAKALEGLLAPGGIVLLQTPCYRGEDKAWEQFRPAEHLFLFNGKNIHQLMARAGLKVTATFDGMFPDDMYVVCRRASELSTSRVLLDHLRAITPIRRRATKAERRAAIAREG
ncbi:MAG: class I SAM-dependent methyltransferase, partial [Acidobacteriota bacterium]|nr:class I SAM-dependent methyltransferase [Acidobacteriota bacterium]